MSTSHNKRKKVVKTTEKRPKVTPTKSRASSATSKPEIEPLLYEKKHYYIFLSGFILIALGLILMTGGGSTDVNVFEPEKIYSFRRTVIAPLFIIAGLLVEVYGIFKK